MGRMPGPGRNVVVLAGGCSAERAVSLASGQQMAAALEEAGHRVWMLDPARSDLQPVRMGRFDACVLALHGGAGEDGTIQQRLERWGVPFSGSRAVASARAMRKSAAKALFRRWGLSTPDDLLLPPGMPVDAFRAPLSRLGFPMVVKPEGEGSSIGVGVARSMEQLRLRVAESRACGRWVLLEKQIVGREFTVSLLGRRPLPLLEIVGPGVLFDYQSKYSSRETQYRFDTRLPDAVNRRLSEIAVRAAEALGTTGLARVDLMLDEQHRPWVLEVNTLPGMTDHSLAPKAARRLGLSPAALCDWLVRDAIDQTELQRAESHTVALPFGPARPFSPPAGQSGRFGRGTPWRSADTNTMLPVLVKHTTGLPVG